MSRFSWRVAYECTRERRDTPFVFDLSQARKTNSRLPWGDSLTDLARQTGLSVTNLSKRFNRARRSGWKKGKVKQVWVEFTDEEWKRLKAGEEV